MGNGAIDIKASFKTGTDFNLPRLALQTSLNPALDKITCLGVVLLRTTKTARMQPT